VGPSPGEAGSNLLKSGRRRRLTKRSSLHQKRSSLRGRTKVAKVGPLRARVKSAKVRPTPYVYFGRAAPTWRPAGFGPRPAGWPAGFVRRPGRIWASAGRRWPAGFFGRPSRIWAVGRPDLGGRPAGFGGSAGRFWGSAGRVGRAASRSPLTAQPPLTGHRFLRLQR
jgi:hypothetical protein